MNHPTIEQHQIPNRFVGILQLLEKHSFCLNGSLLTLVLTRFEGGRRLNPFTSIFSFSLSVASLFRDSFFVEDKDKNCNKITRGIFFDNY